MSDITFYRQYRRDNGARTAVTVDGETVLHRFDRGDEDWDPVLLWYVDLRCKGRSLPAGAEEARQWLLDNSGVIRAGLEKLADELRAGLDVSAWPLQWRVPGTGRGVRMNVVCSVVRRLEGIEIANILRDLAAHWEELVRGLPSLDPVGEE
jgi:hypothetical protein